MGVDSCGGGGKGHRPVRVGRGRGRGRNPLLQCIAGRVICEVTVGHSVLLLPTAARPGPSTAHCCPAKWPPALPYPALPCPASASAAAAEGFQPGSIFRGRIITGRVTTEWGHISLVDAARRLLTEALRDPLNQR